MFLKLNSRKKSLAVTRVDEIFWLVTGKSHTLVESGCLVHYIPPDQSIHQVNAPEMDVSKSVSSSIPAAGKVSNITRCLLHFLRLELIPIPFTLVFA